MITVLRIYFELPFILILIIGYDRYTVIGTITPMTLFPLLFIQGRSTGPMV